MKETCNPYVHLRLKSNCADIQLVVDRKTIFVFLPKAERGLLKKSFFLQKYRNYRKELFLQKDPLLAETASFCKKILLLQLDEYQI